jgi:hypothetical protein
MAQWCIGQDRPRLRLLNTIVARCFSIRQEVFESPRLGGTEKWKEEDKGHIWQDDQLLLRW